MPSINDILAFVGSVFAILIVLPMHEFAHAFAAVKCGDETPRVYGRYTLNPFKHFDLFGLISLLIVHFGWAKPMPINPVNFKHYRRDYFWVSVAGVLANLIGSFLFYPLSELMFLAAGAVYEIVFLYYLFLLIAYIFRACLICFQSDSRLSVGRIQGVGSRVEAEQQISRFFASVREIYSLHSDFLGICRGCCRIPAA